MIRYTGEGPLLGLLAFDHLLTRQEECSIEFHSEQSKAARFKVGVGVNRLYINTTASTPGLTPWLAINLSTLSTSAPARCVGVDRNVFRRGTCDRGIWTKSLAFAADAEELIFTLWVFNGRFAI